VTADGRPVVRKITPNVIAATGHGMWGMVLGPATGEAVTRILLNS